jgi:hypothetical protein
LIKFHILAALVSAASLVACAVSRNTTEVAADQSHQTGDTADQSHRTGDTADQSHRTGDTADQSHRTGDTADTSHRRSDTADQSSQAPQALASVHAQVDFQEPQRVGAKFNLPQGKALRIRNDLGDVRLRFGGYEHQLEVHSVAQAPKGASFASWRFDEATGALEAALIDATPIVKGQRIDVTVWIPKGHSVQIDTLAGLIEVRGLKSDVVVRSNSGAIAVRGIEGALDLQTGAGSIEASITEFNSPKLQRLVTSTGVITAAFAPKFVGDLTLATSGLFASEFSLIVSPQAGQEPNKTATVRIGEGVSSISGNQFEIGSKRGEIRIYRGVEYVDAGE